MLRAKTGGTGDAPNDPLKLIILARVHKLARLTYKQYL
jgi:hypothetical protein